MLSVEHLYRLIVSLNKSEKRYFDLFTQLQGGEKGYMFLYKLIQKCNGDPDLVRTQFLEKHNLPLLEISRKHLYKMLMKSLRNFHHDKSVEVKLRNQISNIELLFEKGLIEPAFSLLSKTKALALKTEKFSYFQILARMELQQLTALEFVNATEDELIQKQEKINEVFYHQLFINKHSSLYEVLLHRYFKQGQIRSFEDTRKLNDLALEEHQVNSNKHYNSFESSILHLHFQSTYFLMTGNHTESHKLYEELLLLFEENKDLWEDSSFYYTYLINGILTGLRSSKKYEAMKQFIEMLEQLSRNYNTQNTQVREIILSHKLSILVELKNLDTASHLIEEYLKERPKNVVLKNSQIQLYLQFAIVFFWKKRFSDALSYVNHVLNSKNATVSNQQYSLYRVLNLIIHMEQGDDDYLIYEIRSVERKLRLQKKFYRTEKVLIDFFKKYLQVVNKKKLIAEHIIHLEELQNDEYERELLIQFDFVQWLKDKIL